MFSPSINNKSNARPEEVFFGRFSYTLLNGSEGIFYFVQQLRLIQKVKIGQEMAGDSD